MGVILSWRNFQDSKIEISSKVATEILKISANSNISNLLVILQLGKSHHRLKHCNSPPLTVSASQKGCSSLPTPCLYGKCCSEIRDSQNIQKRFLDFHVFLRFSGNTSNPPGASRFCLNHPRQHVVQVIHKPLSWDTCWSNTSSLKSPSFKVSTPPLHDIFLATHGYCVAFGGISEDGVAVSCIYIYI